MTRRALGVISSLALVVAACADGNATYVDEATAIIETMRTDSIAATPRGGTISRHGVTAVNEARRTAAAALSAIEPTDDFRPEHRALVRALDELVTAVERFLEDTAAMDEEQFADAVGEASDIQALTTAVGRACTALDARVTGLGIDADVRC